MDMLNSLIKVIDSQGVCIKSSCTHSICTIVICQLYFNKAGRQKDKTVRMEMSHWFPRQVFSKVQAGGDTKRHGEILAVIKYFAYWLIWWVHYYMYLSILAELSLKMMNGILWWLWLNTHVTQPLTLAPKVMVIPSVGISAKALQCPVGRSRA